MAALDLRLAFSEEERAQLRKVDSGSSKRGYIAEMGEHPQTIGYPLLDSPLGLAAWMLDHDADSYEKISRAFLDGSPSGGLTRDHVLDNITLYWLTNTAASAARLYWETGRGATAALKQPPPHVSLPVAFTVFPGELFQAPRHWVEEAYHNLIYFNEVDKGGHFAAWEEPELFAERDASRRSRRCAREVVMSSTVETATEIRPFHVEIPEEQLDDLRRRIAATRWPSKELVADRSQGVQLATLQELARYWATDYDWRKVEAKLNALPQFTTEIDGVDIHFIHVKSPHENALPLIMTHGWPGSVIELLEIVGPLTDPTAHGGDAEDAFDLVLPSAARLRLLRRADARSAGTPAASRGPGPS